MAFSAGTVIESCGRGNKLEDAWTKIWHAAETAGPFGAFLGILGMLLFLRMYLREVSRHDATRDKLELANRKLTEATALRADSNDIQARLLGRLLEREWDNAGGRSPRGVRVRPD